MWRKIKLPFYDFVCPESHTTEEYFGTISEAKSSIKCPKCGAKAERIISTGIGSAFHGAPFSYGTEKRMKEVQQAMDDFRTGKGDKKNES